MSTTTSPQSPPRKQSLDLAQTAYLAHTTRRKLSDAASRADHDLRVLVGHANFLDSLLLELAEAHKDQDRSSPPSTSSSPAAVQRVEEPKRRANIADGAVHGKPVDDWEVWESDESESDGSDSDSGDDKSENATATVVMTAKSWMPRPGLAREGSLAVVAREVGERDDDEDDEYGDLALVRSFSHSPPRLLSSPFA